ncbi:RNA 2'-phosphotransferase [uncultured Roseibium sp.]|uniref:RNA 2'-phosphotransferase n=1 Tax=uncultured Roseibium sp. TaxID=1936171 RepID=UPI002625ECBD|nr:RNA 2'-phosphotransferase [uncultured Roseibium sp.]
MNRNTKISKSLSFWLRHKPDEADIVLSPEGWAAVSDVLKAFEKKKIVCDYELLKQIVTSNDKKRFEFSKDGRCIRARQGHSISIDLGLAPSEPPNVLFHGTATRFLQLIQKEGLKPMKRHHVHLSPDANTAVTVGARHGKPVVLEVAAKEMCLGGFVFFQTENGVWLTNSVPEKFLSLHQSTTTSIT